MNLGSRLKSLRCELGLSQEAFGAQGFVSTPGWIKIENEQRLPSEKLIERLVNWLVSDKYLRATAADGLKQELLTLRYLGSRSPFLRKIASAHAESLPNGATLLRVTPKVKAVRGRPRKHAAPHEIALVAETPGIYKTARNQGIKTRN